MSIINRVSGYYWVIEKMGKKPCIAEWKFERQLWFFISSSYGRTDDEVIAKNETQIPNLDSLITFKKPEKIDYTNCTCDGCVNYRKEKGIREKDFWSEQFICDECNQWLPMEKIHYPSGRATYCEDCAVKIGAE